MIDLKGLPERLQRKRKASHLTQLQLAERIGKTESTIRKYEAGIVEPPLSVIIDIAGVYNITVEELLGCSSGLIFIDAAQIISVIKKSNPTCVIELTDSD